MKVDTTVKALKGPDSGTVAGYGSEDKGNTLLYGQHVLTVEYKVRLIQDETSCHRYVTMLRCFFPQTKTDLVREEGMGSRSPSLPGRLLVKTDAKLVGRLKLVLRGWTPRAKLLGYVTGMVGAVERLASRARRS